ncbi:RecQ family ATP-dependent DNA helicase [Flagellimonas pacifica]|uniref:ATP-dependent DNA helicase RecQ n=1 Tax=Flagellimonas pacifica TaxID=1247520 RepID=A0A285MV72_9FLAO|nr:RecQ family ATP-dependent DNA helicase [Allomuricauda parva]SNY99706.1 ATP-dependent DNA helicase RecQ [Allomuricauda parva]
MQQPKAILREFWSHEDFRGSQGKIINAVIKGEDVLALMPTGGGKSICYQVPALTQEGICIVVSPLVALIQDQVNQLKERDIKAIALIGGISFEEVTNLLDNCIYGNYKFLYLSPERLQQSLVQERIREMNVNLLAIDEAHCISHWGNDFRPAYLDCAILKDLAPNAPMIALTATATPKVVDDIVENLKLDQVKVFKDSFSRANIIFKIKKTEDKLYHLKKIIQDNPESGIVYVRSRKMTISIADFLNKNGFKASFFHGGISKNDKKEKLDSWLAQKTNIMVATNAFGMGVDKPNVRLVVHYQIPDSLESYFQEAGRAGRDGKTSTAVLLTNNEDKERAKQQFLSTLPDVSFIKKLYVQLNNYFQIPYGELVQETLEFEFNAFCKRYALNPNMTYHGLRILDQNSVISLSENYNEKTTLKFVASKTGIFEYLRKQHNSAAIIQTILRTYGGITDHDTKINILLLSKKTGESEKRVKQLLMRLHDDGIATYKSSSSDIEITFLVPREDDRTINPFAKKIKDFNKIKHTNLKSMVDYIDSTTTCRSVFLLNYFGESTKDKCGTCDICTAKNIVEPDTLENKIISLLKKSPLTSRQLMLLTHDDEKIVLEILQRLLEDQIIQLNQKNEYKIKE